jgi:hypothetical protein
MACVSEAAHIGLRVGDGVRPEVFAGEDGGGNEGRRLERDNESSETDEKIRGNIVLLFFAKSSIQKKITQKGKW